MYIQRNYLELVIHKLMCHNALIIRYKVIVKYIKQCHQNVQYIQVCEVILICQEMNFWSSHVCKVKLVVMFRKINN